MHRNELHNLVVTASRHGASMEADEQLVGKVLAMTGARSTLRFVAAATLFHCWLLKGRPDMATWQYRARLQCAREVMSIFMRLPASERRDLAATRKAKPELEQASDPAVVNAPP